MLKPKEFKLILLDEFLIRHFAHSLDHFGQKEEIRCTLSHLCSGFKLKRQICSQTDQFFKRPLSREAESLLLPVIRKPRSVMKQLTNRNALPLFRK